MRVNDLRMNIAIVPQDCVLFNDTVMYNIAYGGIKDPAVAKRILDSNEEDELIKGLIPCAK
jgi:ABC-type transport system involved in Fe-S cluster assembly fused permease/ATPase subunit